MVPYISIIVPVYNTEQYLEQCIRSLIRQTLEEIEIILVDDGSQDKSGWICDQYAKLDERVKVIHKKNEGHTRARITGTENAKGKFIGFVDSDDWIEENMYQVLYRQIVLSNADIVSCGAYENSNKEKKIHQTVQAGLYYGKALTEKVYASMLFSGKFYEFGILPSLCNKVFKREIILKCLKKVNPEIKYGEDAACVYPAILESKKVCIIEKYLYHYRIVKNSISRRYDKNYFLHMNKLIQFLLEEFQNHFLVMADQMNYYITLLFIRGVDNELLSEKPFWKKVKFIQKQMHKQEIREALSNGKSSILGKKYTLYVALLRYKLIWLLLIAKKLI